jgi:hypothetical protein
MSQLRLRMLAKGGYVSREPEGCWPEVRSSSVAARLGGTYIPV